MFYASLAGLTRIIGDSEVLIESPWYEARTCRSEVVFFVQLEILKYRLKADSSFGQVEHVIISSLALSFLPSIL